MSTPDNPKKLYGDKKPPIAQLPLVARVAASGAHFDGDLKYGFRNWREQPVEANTYINAAERHLALWAEGEEFARDTGVNNLGAVIACCAILLDAQVNNSLIDNRSHSKAAADYLHNAEALIERIKQADLMRHAAVPTEAVEGDPYLVTVPQQTRDPAHTRGDQMFLKGVPDGVVL